MANQTYASPFRVEKAGCPLVFSLVLTGLLQLTGAEAMAAEANPEATPAVSPAQPPAPDLARINNILNDDSITGRITTWTWYAELGAGYDSNVLQRTSNTPMALDYGSLSEYGLVRGSWRIINQGTDQLTLNGSIRSNAYPEATQANIIQMNSSLNGQLAAPLINPLGTLSAGRDIYDIDEGIATRFGAEFGGFTVSDDQYGLNRYTVLIQNTRYDLNEPGSGMLYSANYRHWWMMEPGNGRRRFEFNLNGGIYLANTDSASYRFLKPSLGWYYRMNSQVAEAGTIDWSLVTQLEIRSYDGSTNKEPQEHQSTWGIAGSADRWLSNVLKIGIFSGVSHRNASVASHVYDRFQIGVRLGYAW